MKALILSVALFSQTGLAETFKFKGATVKGNVTKEQAEAINKKWGQQKGGTPCAPRLQMSAQLNFAKARGGDSCIALCTDHPGYELFGKPLNQEPVSESIANSIVDRHTRTTSHRGTAVICGQ